MLAWLLAGLVSAGTIYIDADKAVLVKVDGDLERLDPATRIIVPDLPDGTYKVEITNVLGDTVAWMDVQVGSDDINLEYMDGVLDEIKEQTEVVYGERGLPLMPHDKFAKLERKLVKGSAKKKLKVMNSLTEGYNLSMAQTDDMLAAFHKREDRLMAVYAIIDKVAEPSKYAVLTHHFAVTSDLEKMRALFEAILANQPKPEAPEE